MVRWKKPKGTTKKVQLTSPQAENLNERFALNGKEYAHNI